MGKNPRYNKSKNRDVSKAEKKAEGDMDHGFVDKKFPLKLAMWDFNHCDPKDALVRSLKDLDL